MTKRRGCGVWWFGGLNKIIGLKQSSLVHHGNHGLTRLWSYIHDGEAACSISLIRTP